MICRYVFLKDIQTFVEVANFILGIYDENPHHPLCQKYAAITEKVIKCILSFYIVFISTTGASISFCAVFSDKMAFPIVFPGINIDQIEGNILNAVLQIVI